MKGSKTKPNRAKQLTGMDVEANGGLHLDEVETWNKEDASELVRSSVGTASITVTARDWTIETMIQQIRQGHIDLDPEFQRRNAWKDHRRSRLVESFILNFPVPQVVLAENPRARRTYIVIDGKQRLMTLAGLYLDEYRGYWSQPTLSGLAVLKRLNGVSLDELRTSAEFEAERRQLDNADVRTTVITGFTDESVLYDIFYRINTGSVPLSTQELRQVLNRGEFARYLLRTTSTPNPLWTAMGVHAPDARLRDVELLLRLVAWRRFASEYRGNLKKFLDDAMVSLNRGWRDEAENIRAIVRQVMLAVEAGQTIFGDSLGHKYKDGNYEGQLNRAVFEVQVYYLTDPSLRRASTRSSAKLRAGFERLSSGRDFLASVESTTKSLQNYQQRFDDYRRMLRKTIGVTAPRLPLAKD